MSVSSLSRQLGVLQMWQSLSFSLSLPVWGIFLPALGAFPVCMCMCMCVRACVRACVRIRSRASNCMSVSVHGSQIAVCAEKGGWTGNSRARAQFCSLSPALACPSRRGLAGGWSRRGGAHAILRRQSLKP